MRAYLLPLILCFFPSAVFSQDLFYDTYFSATIDLPTAIVADDFELEIYIVDGANLSRSERENAVPGRISGFASELRTGRQELATFVQLLSGTTHVLSYGLIYDGDAGRQIVGFVPVSIHSVEPGEAQNITLTFERFSDDFFQRSYPFSRNNDPDLMNEDNAWRVLLSLQAVFELFQRHRDEMQLGTPQWERLVGFLQGNRDYLINAEPEVASSLLGYLSSSSALTDSHQFQRGYGIFLNELLDQIPTDESQANPENHALAERVINSLRLLYQARLKSSYFSADDTIGTLTRLGYVDHCMDIARIVMSRMDDSFFRTVEFDLHIRWVLRYAFECAGLAWSQNDFGERGPGPIGNELAVAEFLSSTPEGRDFGRNYRRLIEQFHSRFPGFGNQTNLSMIGLANRIEADLLQ